MKYTKFKFDGYSNRSIGEENYAVIFDNEEKLISKLNKKVVNFYDNKQVAILDKVSPNALKNETFVINGSVVDPCTLCKKRLIKLTTGCSTCNFEFLDENIQNEFYNSDEVNMIEILKDINAEEVKLRHAFSNSVQKFENSIYSLNEIDLEEDNILENKKILSERSKKAVETKKIKKEFCSTCVFNSTNNKCKFSSPSICKGNYKLDEDKAVEKVFNNISDPKKLLNLSQICGLKIKYNKKRFRISKVINEISEEFLLTRDYSPWDTEVLNLKQLIEINKDISEYIQLDLSDVKESRIKEMASTLKLINSNWSRIYSIESWQNQHMFVSSYNKSKDRIDISIHLSKDTYDYNFKNLKEVTQKVSGIII